MPDDYPRAVVREIDGQLVLDDPEALGMIQAVEHHNKIHGWGKPSCWWEQAQPRRADKDRGGQPMNYEEFLTEAIDRGLKSVAGDERMAKYPKRVEGSVAGFEACRGKTPEQLAQLLVEANRKTLNARMDYKGPIIEEYWKQVHFGVQIEWVCNTVSALFMNQGLPTIITPTARGLINAAAIVGVQGAN